MIVGLTNEMRKPTCFPQGFSKGLMWFRNSISTTGVNIPEKMVDYVLKVAKNVKN